MTKNNNDNVSLHDELVSAFHIDKEGDEPLHQEQSLGKDEGFTEDNPLSLKQSDDDQKKEVENSSNVKSDIKTDADTDTEAEAAKPKNPQADNDNKNTEQSEAVDYDPPVKWTKEEKELFNKLSTIEDGQYNDMAKSLQEILVNHNKSMEGAYTKKFQELAEQRKEFDEKYAGMQGFDDVINPYLDDYKRLGVEPKQMLAETLKLEQQARTNPVGFAKWFVDQYNISPENLGISQQAAQSKVIVVDDQGNILDTFLTDDKAANDNAPASRPQQQSNASAQQYANLPPQFVDQINSLSEEVKRLNSLNQQTAQQQAETEFNNFVNATDNLGQLKHPFYNDVRDDMAEIMKVKPDLPLEQAYNIAVYSKPGLAQKITESKELSIRKELERQAIKDAQSAQIAGSALGPATSSVQVANDSNDSLSLRDDLMRQFRSDGASNTV